MKKKMTYGELVTMFREHELNRPKDHLRACIVFTEDSFEEKYPEISRSYCISSDNKAFQQNMSGYSIFASCLDGTDPCVRLDWYMKVENPKTGDWEVEYCYLMGDEEE